MAPRAYRQKLAGYAPDYYKITTTTTTTKKKEKEKGKGKGKGEEKKKKKKKKKNNNNNNNFRCCRGFYKNVFINFQRDKEHFF